MCVCASAVLGQMLELAAPAASKALKKHDREYVVDKRLLIVCLCILCMCVFVRQKWALLELAVPILLESSVRQGQCICLALMLAFMLQVALDCKAKSYHSFGCKSRT